VRTSQVAPGGHLPDAIITLRSIGQHFLGRLHDHLGPLRRLEVPLIIGRTSNARPVTGDVRHSP
jgi:hypothetical protein